MKDRRDWWEIFRKVKERGLGDEDVQVKSQISSLGNRTQLRNTGLQGTRPV